MLACAAPTPPETEFGKADASTILRIVREREDRIATLRARFLVETTHRDEPVKHADGVVLVRKPYAFRLRLMLPLGLTILDYLSSKDETRVSLPLGSPGSPTPDRDEFVPFSREDLGQAFLRGPWAFPGACTARASDASVVMIECRDDADQLMREIDVDALTGHIREERSYRDGTLRLRFSFSDYRPADGTDLPYRIVLIYPEDGITMRIEIARYEINPRLDERLFRAVDS